MANKVRDRTIYAILHGKDTVDKNSTATVLEQHFQEEVHIQEYHVEEHTITGSSAVVD